MKNLVCHKDCARSYRNQGIDNGILSNVIIGKILKKHEIDSQVIGDKVYAIEDYYINNVWQQHKVDVTNYTVYDIRYYLGY